mgnify:CR=1 FL=1
MPFNFAGMTYWGRFCSESSIMYGTLYLTSDRLISVRQSCSPQGFVPLLCPSPAPQLDDFWGETWRTRKGGRRVGEEGHWHEVAVVDNSIQFSSARRPRSCKETVIRSRASASNAHGETRSWRGRSTASGVLRIIPARRSSVPLSRVIGSRTANDTRFSTQR